MPADYTDYSSNSQVNGALKPIETHYKGYRFRSRLEARWAVFWDSLGISWEYEPEGFELGDGLRYLPDFKVNYPDQKDVWFEVKGDINGMSQHDWDKVARFSEKNTLFILDGTPACRMYGGVSNWLAHGEVSKNKHYDFWDGPSPLEDPAFADVPALAAALDSFQKYSGCRSAKLKLEINETIVVPYQVTSYGSALKRFGVALWSYKGRPWWDDHSDFFRDVDEQYHTDIGQADIAFAVKQALSARFEFGDKGGA